MEFQVGDQMLLKLTPQIWKKISSKTVHWGLIPKYDGPFEVIKKVEKCGEALTKWGKDCFGNVRTELEKKKRELARAKKEAIQRGYSNNLIQLKKDINSLMDKEERMWR